jgi:hypothetical protein
MLFNSERRECHFVTRKTTLLLSVPLGVVTSTVPVVAPVGTLVVIKEAETTLKTAAVPFPQTGLDLQTG